MPRSLAIATALCLSAITTTACDVEEFETEELEELELEDSEFRSSSDFCSEFDGTTITLRPEANSQYKISMEGEIESWNIRSRTYTSKLERMSITCDGDQVKFANDWGGYLGVELWASSGLMQSNDSNDTFISEWNVEADGDGWLFYIHRGLLTNGANGYNVLTYLSWDNDTKVPTTSNYASAPSSVSSSMVWLAGKSWNFCEQFDGESISLLTSDNEWVSIRNQLGFVVSAGAYTNTVCEDEETFTVECDDDGETFDLRTMNDTYLAPYGSPLTNVPLVNDRWTAVNHTNGTKSLVNAAWYGEQDRDGALRKEDMHMQEHLEANGNHLSGETKMTVIVH